MITECTGQKTGVGDGDSDTCVGGVRDSGAALTTPKIWESELAAVVPAVVPNICESDQEVSGAASLSRLISVTAGVGCANWRTSSALAVVAVVFSVAAVVAAAAVVVAVAFSVTAVVAAAAVVAAVAFSVSTAVSTAAAAVVAAAPVASPVATPRRFFFFFFCPDRFPFFFSVFAPLLILLLLPPFLVSNH